MREIKKMKDDTWVRRQKILSYLNLEFRKDSDNFHFDIEIADKIKIEYNLVASECKLLRQENLLEKGDVANIGTSYRITTLGIQKHDTDYNLDWLSEQKAKESLQHEITKDDEQIKFEIEERRHREMVNAAKGSKIFKIVAVSAVVISLFALFGVDDILNSPTIKIEPFFADANSTTTQMFLNVWNTGNSPATNVLVTLNPNADFIYHKLIYSAEDISLKSNGARSLIAFTPRLSMGEHIGIDTLIGIPNERNHFDIYVTYDQGKKIHYSSNFDGKPAMDRLEITVPADAIGGELRVYDPVTDEFVPMEPYP